MTEKRVIPTVGIVFCITVILALTQAAVPLDVLLPAILPLGGIALVLLLSIFLGPRQR